MNAVVILHKEHTVCIRDFCIGQIFCNFIGCSSLERRGNRPSVFVDHNAMNLREMPRVSIYKSRMVYDIHFIAVNQKRVMPLSNLTFAVICILPAPSVTGHNTQTDRSESVICISIINCGCAVCVYVFTVDGCAAEYTHIISPSGSQLSIGKIQIKIITDFTNIRTFACALITTCDVLSISGAFRKTCLLIDRKNIDSPKPRTICHPKLIAVVNQICVDCIRRRVCIISIRLNHCTAICPISEQRVRRKKDNRRYVATRTTQGNIHTPLFHRFIVNNVRRPHAFFQSIVVRYSRICRFSLKIAYVRIGQVIIKVLPP